MYPSFIPPRQVMIGDAAWFADTTPRAIRHYEQIGLLPEPERTSNGRRLYSYEVVVRLFWIRKMADAGIALNDIRRVFAAPAPAGATSDRDIVDVLEQLDADLAAQETELQRKRAAVQRMRTRGSTIGLLNDFVAQRLENLPEGSLSQAHMDNLVITERILGPLGAAIHAGRYLALAAHPALREESDRIDAAEESLDDTVSVDDPRVERVAAERHAFERALQEVIASSGQGEEDDALFDLWENLHATTTDSSGLGSHPKRRRMSAFEALGRMPYDFSPARLRCMEVVERIAADEAAAP
ncbi:MerR family DNA-binding transcriptional regulator [Microbacterium hatanonis]|jgi:DNA-binding transcriptional MerR regulator|uniref:MerR family transcriptional regulator n=1 Tax=Microbacterium hatanonis TaxID=404366 RepID=A0A5C8I088_9MICO|nr:MerR family transcriptional regulator [Microbacterium hatanonis]TXK12317.1 MerR family transcriptional regulator [Microbacterium hatanonis]